MSGPEATARPLTAPQMPYAMPRSAAGTAAVSRVSVSGIMIAAPTPWTARAAISAVDAGRQGRGGGGAGEDDEADEEEPAAAEPVAERRTEHQEDCEGECVGAHRPFQVLQRTAEVLADGGQGGGDDEVVEGRHESGDAGDDEGPDGSPARAVGCASRPQRWSLAPIDGSVDLVIDD